MPRLKWKVIIEELDSGFIVHIGCKNIATSMSWVELLQALADLRENPDEMYKKWFPEDFTKKDILIGIPGEAAGQLQQNPVPDCENRN